MNVASLELCKELYALSGWDDTYLRWANFKTPRVVNADEWNNNMGGEPDLIITDGEILFEDRKNLLDPAYDLGYLLRKLPQATTINIYSARVNKGSRGIGQRTIADTPEDAAAKLCIQLIKQGVLK